MAAKKQAGSRKPARNPVHADQRLDDVCFYWSRLTETQRDRLYTIVAKLCENNESNAGAKEENQPRIVLYDPRTKKME
jgi:hypothetical protein